MIVKSRKSPVERQLNVASQETQAPVFYYLIYDKSTETECDRLICVKPFNWLIWAKYGQVYILNQTQVNCSVNDTPATKVPSTVLGDTYDFTDVCLSFRLTDILSNYTDTIAPVTVLYSVPSTASKYTVLDALNHLFTRYINMVPSTPETEAKESLNMSRIINTGVRMNLSNFSADLNNLTVTEKNNIKQLLQNRDAKKSDPALMPSEKTPNPFTKLINYLRPKSANKDVLATTTTISPSTLSEVEMEQSEEPVEEINMDEDSVDAKREPIQQPAKPKLVEAIATTAATTIKAGLPVPKEGKAPTLVKPPTRKHRTPLVPATTTKSYIEEITEATAATGKRGSKPQLESVNDILNVDRPGPRFTSDTLSGLNV